MVSEGLVTANVLSMGFDFVSPLLPSGISYPMDRVSKFKRGEHVRLAGLAEDALLNLSLSC